MSTRSLPFLALLLVACGGDDAAPAPLPPPPPEPVVAPSEPPPTTEVAGPGSSVETRAPAPATGCPATDPAARGAAGTVHRGSLDSGAEILDRAGSPHRFPEGFRIATGATVRIEPCALVLVGGEGRQFVVAEGAELVAAGSELEPIVFAYERPAAPRGSWAGVFFESGARPSSQLTWVTVESAGHETGWVPAAAVWAGGELRLDVQHLTVRGSASSGIALADGAEFAPSATAITIEGSGDPAIASGAVYFVRASAVGSLPEGSYASNETPWIWVSDGQVSASATWRSPGVGVPYRIENDLRVNGPSGPTLTLSPGVMLAFAAERRLLVGVDEDGALVADGGAEETRIVLTSGRSSAAPGDWGGVFFGEHALRNATRLRFVDVRFAGRVDDWIAPSQCGDPRSGAIEMALDLGPAISNVRVTDVPEGSRGIVRGFSGDVVSSYTLADLHNELPLGRCGETFAAPAAGCPDPLPECTP